MNSFTDEMVKELMAKVQLEKIKGWDDPESFEELQKELLECLRNADWVNVAGLAMLIWNLGHPDAPK